MKCNKCKKEFEEKEIHEHHVHPKFMNNKKGVGEKIHLCEKCHNILHLTIPSVIYKHVPFKDICINAVTKFTKGWINDNYKTG